MLNINQALNLSSGDTVYDNQGQLLKIQNYQVKFHDESIQTVIFGCVNSKQQKCSYPYYHLFISPNNIKNSERSFINWSINNSNLLEQVTHKQLDAIRKAYCDGFENTLTYLAEEQLQK